jgi:hypothetical protein
MLTGVGVVAVSLDPAGGDKKVMKEESIFVVF